MIGTTISHRHLRSLGISTEEAVSHMKELNISQVRIGCYWDEIEKKRGVYTFTETDLLLHECQKAGLSVIITLGMKAPRYPEFYLPQWLESRLYLPSKCSLLSQKGLTDALFPFLTKTIQHYSPQKGITHWQVENEPLDPSGPNWWNIHPTLLEQEIQIVKQQDTTRPIVITLWGNELSQRHLYPHITKLADVVGIDLYPRVPSSTFFKRKVISGPLDSDVKLRTIFSQIKSTGKELWISELQAEPWTYPETCLPHHLSETIAWAAQFQTKRIYLWGYEYWLQKKQKGDMSYWNRIQTLLTNN